MDLFRIFDCLNWVENMRVAIDAVVESGKLAEGAICYTGDILDPDRAKYSLDYYVGLAKELEARRLPHPGASRTWPGCSSPPAARVLIKALKDEVGLPIHFHTHDTSGIAGRQRAGRGRGRGRCGRRRHGRHVGPDLAALPGLDRRGAAPHRRATPASTPRRSASSASTGRRCAPSTRRSRATCAPGASEVYLHEMPGGQFTNLKEQARSLGLETRWHEVARAYRAANDLFGDIVKVTPSSKVVGDMALMMVAQGLTPADVLDPAREIAFPASVVEMLHGDLGQPPGGWPAAVQQKALKGEAPITVAAGLAPARRRPRGGARRGREALRPRSSTRTSSPPT